MIHWCGTGLSSGPGLARLAQAGTDLRVWAGDVDEPAARAAAAAGAPVHPFDVAHLSAEVAPGDVVVSMLPADMHVALAAHAVARSAHFVSASYMSEAVARLGPAAAEAGVALMTEVGLDPGLDHVMAHDLLTRYRAAGPDPADTLRLTSACGGMPVDPGPFAYKFAWSPLGVLQALTHPAQTLVRGQVARFDKPWEGTMRLTLPLDPPETFEAVPNRDSLPYRALYGMDPAWDVETFQRLTLRPLGWQAAWREVFPRLEAEDLSPLAADLAERHAYAPGEADRAVLYVALEAVRGDATVWHQAWVLTATGNAEGSAMARVVSGQVAVAAEAAAAGDVPPGPTRATQDPRLIERFLDAARRDAQRVERMVLVT